MNRHSLRLRLVAGGIVAILIALAIAGGALVVVFQRHVSRTLAQDLDVHLKQLLANIDLDAQGKLVLTQTPVDPRFADPLSGLYWQVSDDRGQLLRSRSLWDSAMKLPADRLSPGETHQHEADGPGGQRVLVAERAVTLSAEGKPVVVRLAVAEDLARVTAATSAFAKDLSIALVLLGSVLALATWVQVGVGLHPLVALRRGVADIRAGRSRHLPSSVPSEVQPLVEEVNALVDAQEAEIERSRGRAADLAHGLKTPLAALAADASRLRERGEREIARDIEAVGEVMGRHVDRELARARVRGHARGKAATSTVVRPLVESIVATMSRTPDGMRVAFENLIRDDLTITLDRTDLAEVLGNLIENAARHAAGRVRITSNDGQPSVVVEDDGEGIDPAHLSRVLERGVRLDQRGGAAGLGLAIVQDVLDAYGWGLELSSSELGGLKAVIAVRPGVSGRPSRPARASVAPSA
ncbi:sensor histidine kinase [Bradyrhizobium guangdongense]|uniref:histidine kinase n=1 Tax=Bradyrhizobium guangdongense TaxID=1325090 RepID=A0A410VBA5_9BRAD|nr:HAMP domain-containing sensor histidine kinase [Bradyrhizobium guangdongense]QAU41009.1 sensor histidine kinase [Bradyrhizobium guangdongense]QOZ62070.1 sensor histidine kinase [Bradyrhizobium guangdongense]GGI21206.1 histidine kinase [Bradyrhizobium guangdongense]